MRSTFLLLILGGSLITLACKRQETTNPSDAKAEVETVCQHMLDLMIADVGDLIDFTPEKAEETKSACIADFEARQAASPKEFAKMAECVKQATTVQQIPPCG